MESIGEHVLEEGKIGTTAGLRYVISLRWRQFPARCTIKDGLKLPLYEADVQPHQ